MGGVAKPPEHRIKCLSPLARRSGDEQLRFEIDGKTKGINLKISRLRRSLITSLPDKAIDLIEIAAFVYAIDASVSRGGPVDQRMGAKWHRRFLVELPVRDLALWSNPDVQRDLEKTLMFLSGDGFEFTFTQLDVGKIIEPNRYFDFGEESSWSPDTVMMFSGGLDSFAGALEEIVERRNKVALISHFSASKVAPVQSKLAKALAEAEGGEMLRHLPMRVQLIGGTNKEGTHRSRSFLFAALGMVTATAFGRDGVSFFENGVVSLNLPPVGNVLGTRATRTTHPQTLDRFTGLFSRIFDKPLRVDNPFFWRTKTEVVSTIAKLGMSDQIANTRSCADVYNQTIQHPHCGRCSQCIDRRFAMLAAGLEGFDHDVDYRTDLMKGARVKVQDKEVVLSYVRNALGYEVITPLVLEQHFPEVLSAVKYLKEPVPTALSRLSDLFKRHGKAVAGVMRKTINENHIRSIPEDSLPSMFGELQRSQAFAIAGTPARELSSPSEPEKLQLVFDRQRKSLLIDGAIEITKNATFKLLLILAEEHLRAAGQGLELLEYSTLSARNLRKQIGLDSEGALRRRVMRSRTFLAGRFASAGMDGDRGRLLIENLPGSGYRLDPDLVEVRMK